MGVDLGTILAVMGTVFSGNAISLKPGFSIGGSSKKVNNILGNIGGLLGERTISKLLALFWSSTGTPSGLNTSHNFIESDSSNTRDDLYVTGDAWTLNLKLFTEAYTSSETDEFTFDQIGKRAADRWAASKATNPSFYYGPYTGMIARNAGYAFTSRLLSNHTVENPQGLLSRSLSLQQPSLSSLTKWLAKAVFQSFFAVSGEEGSFDYKYGFERIPENWYKSPVDYGLASLNVDLIAWMMQHPELARWVSWPRFPGKNA